MDISVENSKTVNVTQVVRGTSDTFPDKRKILQLHHIPIFLSFCRDTKKFSTNETL